MGPSLVWSADEATCSAKHCTLNGNTRFKCGSLHLAADKLVIFVDHKQRLKAVRADDHVCLTEGGKVIRGHRLVLHAPAMTGFIDRATLTVIGGKNSSVSADPQHSNTLTAHGQLTRHEDKTLSLAQADVTLCECGERKPPSWRLDARRVVVVPNDRATLIWPSLKLALPWVGLTRVTPPLLPLSFSLKARAPGFLPPQISFLGPPYPTIDLPIFVPLGPSFDITLSPGVRVDWAGAPRLSMRLRFFPTPAIKGELQTHTTWDFAHMMAKRADNRARATSPAWVATPSYRLVAAQRHKLTKRVSIKYQHTVALGAQGTLTAKQQPRTAAEWLVEGSWISDDLVNQDLLVFPSERMASYLPARTQLLIRHPAYLAAAGIDSMLRLDSMKTGPDGLPVAQLSNLDGAEATTLQRAPWASFTVPAFFIGGPWRLDGAIDASRYGTWDGQTGPGSGDGQLSLLHATLGVGAAGHVGPARLHARVGSDAIAFRGDIGSGTDVVTVLDAQAALLWAGQIAGRRHTVMPRFVYRGLVHPGPTNAPLLRAQQASLDEHSVRRDSQQLLVSLRQVLWQQAAPKVLRSELLLDLQQPFDLLKNKFLQPQALLQVHSSYFGEGQLRVSFDLRRRGSLIVRDMELGHAAQVGPLHLWANYLRVAPDADRFERSIYELSAPHTELLKDSGFAWGHMLRGGIRINVQQQLDVIATTSAQLARPDLPKGQVEPACQWGTTLGARNCFTSHMLGVRYTSLCKCWNVEASMSAAPQALWQTLRVQAVLSVAGARLGSP